jgi:hypothetical protein
MLDVTQQKGTLTELRCILDLTNLGYRCLKPVDESSKYDIVVDLGKGNFKRIQCKTSSWATDTKEEKVAFQISTCCQTTNTKSTTRHKYSKDDIDYFYTWFEGQGYLVSIEEASGLNFRWRYKYPASNQKQGIHIADDYKIEGVLRVI